MKNFIITAALLLSVTGAQSALAGTSTTDTVQTTISVAQFNLTTKVGAKAAYKHIRNEARKACGVTSVRTSIKAKLIGKACANGMVSQAVDQIDALQLTQIHELSTT